MSYRIGIDLGGTKISGVVLDDAGTELLRQRLPSPREDYSRTVVTVADLVRRLEAAAGVPAGTVPVGVGTPGTWHPRLARMKNCNSTWLNDRPLLPDLQRALGGRVRIANDADCLALSEATDGAGADAGSVFAVILGTGVGGGVVLAGRLQQGPNGLAGEWGHMPLPYLRRRAFPGPGGEAADPAEEARFQLESRLGDRRCYCGRVNCIEGFLSGPGLARSYAELWQREAGPEAIAAGADAEAKRTWALYVHMLARSLAQIVNLLDPEVVVLGGGLSKAPGLDRDLAAGIPAFAFSSVRGAGDVRVAVRLARWGDDSGVRGAARLWDGDA